MLALQRIQARIVRRLHRWRLSHWHNPLKVRASDRRGSRQ